jgi:hypothetical protein
VRDLVLSYYAVIRSTLRTHSHLWPLLKCCRYCRIYFFTGPQNARRHDLRCPFGCRDACRRADSNRRSAAHYRKYPERKAALNRRRYLLSAKAAAEEKKEAEQSRGEEVVAPSDAPVAGIVKHVRLVCSLIEGRAVSLPEVLEMLRQKGRQHRMCRQRRADYIVAQLKDRGS